MEVSWPPTQIILVMMIIIQMNFCSFTCNGFTHSGSYLALIISALEYPRVWECQQFECCLHTAHISHVYNSKTTQFIHGFKLVSHWTTPEKRKLFVRTPCPCKIRLPVFSHTACCIYYTINIRYMQFPLITVYLWNILSPTAPKRQNSEVPYYVT